MGSMKRQSSDDNLLDDDDADLDLQIKRIKTCDNTLRHLLFDLIDARNEEALAKVLRHTRELIPADFMQGLLLFSCSRFFDGAVELLLENGADPNCGIDDDYSPLNFVVDHSGPDRDPIVRERDLARNATPFANILRSLIRHGADVMAPNSRVPLAWFSHRDDAAPIGTNTIALHKLAYVALYGPDAARILIESTPVAGIEAGRIFVNKVKTCCSALSTVFYDIFELESIEGLDAISLTKIVTNAILPLLRAGCWLAPDPLENDGKTGSIFGRPSAFCSLCQLICLKYSRDIWGRDGAFLELVLECRRKSNLDVTKLLNSLTITPANDENSTTGSNSSDEEETNNESSRNGISFDKFSVDAFCAMAPLTLQALCRQVILNQLAVGLEKRLTDIEKLDLPRSVTAYLKFDNFTCLIKQAE